MAVSKLPLPLKQALDAVGVRKMTDVEKILFDGKYVRHYFDPKPGELIYHYTSLEAAKAILEGQSIWLSEYQKTNDASEFTFAKQRFRDEIAKLSTEYSSSSIDVYKERLKGFEDGQCMLIGSFTQNGDDLSQWERYADRASGCVIGFNTYWFWKYPGIRLHKVIYEDGYLKNLVEANLYMMDQAKKLFPQIPLELLATYFVFEQFCFKDHRFSSEQEIRMTRSVQINSNSDSGLDDGIMQLAKGKFPGPFAKPFEVKIRNGAYGQTRYISLPTIFRGSSAVRSIGFGPRCSPTDEQTFIETFKPMKRLKFWRSDIPLR